MPAWASSKPVHFLASPSPASATEEGGSVIPDLGRRCDFFYCPQPPLEYHEGSGVQHTPKADVIFWGSNWNSSPGSEVKTQLLKMYEGFTASAWQGILTQYFDATGRISSTLTVSSYVDTGVSAPTSVNDEKIIEEAASAVKTKGWTRESGSQFIVIPAPGSTYEAAFAEGFCGYHGVDYSGSSYTFVPYFGDEPFKKGCIGFDPEKNVGNVDSMVAAHEYAESATDPLLNEWYDLEGYEIGDICASGDDKLPNGSWVQGLWDDHQNECSLSDENPPHVLGLTEAAAEVKPAEAKLNGVVNPEGSETKYHFEYGTTTSYGSSTTEVSAGSSSKNQAASKTVSGLSHGTTYHFRVVASNSTGTTYGEDRHFETGRTKPIVETKGASSIGTTAATLNGTVNPNGLETKAYFEYSISESELLAGKGTKTTEFSIGSGTSTLEESQAVSGLSESTTYYFRVAASNNDGTVKGVVSSFSTAGPPTVATTTATGVTETGATVAGTVNPRGSETKVYFEYGTTGSYGSKTSEINAGSGTTSVEETKPISSLSKSTTYHFRIVATNSHGTTNGADQTFTTLPWTIQTTPNRSGTSLDRLRGVSCVASTECIAVGDASSTGTLIERWTGGEWSLQTSPNVGEFPVLEDVSCASSSACMAVGLYWSASIVHGLSERWNGTEWISQEVPSPPEAKATELTGISCISSTECIAVGWYRNSSGANLTLAERWNGTEWKILTTQNPATTEDYLKGISCSSAVSCMAVGEYSGNTALAEKWNGFSWSVKNTPAITAGFENVSCTSSTACTAVGTTDTEVISERNLAERWNGTEWKVQETPFPSGGRRSNLKGISCTSATVCTTAGWYENTSGAYFTLAEGWNGSEWVIQKTTTPTGATASFFWGLSCSSTFACTAVGPYSTSTKTLTLAERN